MATHRILANDTLPQESPIKPVDSLGHTPFVVLSPPKSGTHLIGKTLALILKKTPAYYLAEVGSNSEAIGHSSIELRNGRFMIAHNFTADTLTHLVMQGYKIIYMIRDPRDQLISIQNWMREGQWTWIAASRIQNREQQLTELITGTQTNWYCLESCLLRHIARTIKLPRERLYCVRFENIVGEEGGGGIDKQLNEIFALATFLEVPMTIEEAEQIAHQIFGGTKTFRQGQVGIWKNYFTETQKQLFKSRYQEVLIQLGYEADKNW